MTPEELKELIENELRDGLYEIGEQISQEGMNQYDSSAKMFYAEYDPKYYDREYALEEAAEPILRSFQNGMAIQAGVRLHPEITVTNHDPAEYVFQGAFDQGIHGTSQIYVGEPGKDKMEGWHNWVSSRLKEMVKNNFSRRLKKIRKK